MNRSEYAIRRKFIYLHRILFAESIRGNDAESGNASEANLLWLGVIIIPCFFLSVMKQSMIFYASWKEALKGLPDSVRLEVYEAAIDFAMSGDEPELSGTAALAFSFIRQDIIRDMQKYERICERNRANGKKGGAPAGNRNASKAETTQNNPNNPVGAKSTQTTQNNPNDNDNDNEDDNDVYISSDKSSDISTESDTLSPATPQIDLKQLAKFFNSEMRSHKALIPEIRTISGQRKTHTLARIREHGKDTFARMIRIASTNDFLNGKNDRAWVANYDWLVNPSNFVKVIEGNYSSRNGNRNSQYNNEPGSSSTDGEGYDTSL